MIICDLCNNKVETKEPEEIKIGDKVYEHVCNKCLAKVYAPILKILEDEVEELKEESDEVVTLLSDIKHES